MNGRARRNVDARVSGNAGGDDAVERFARDALVDHDVGITTGQIVDPNTVAIASNNAVGGDRSDVDVAGRWADHDAVAVGAGDAANKAVALHAGLTAGANEPHAVEVTSDGGEVLNRLITTQRPVKDTVRHRARHDASALAVGKYIASGRHGPDTGAAFGVCGGGDARCASRCSGHDATESIAAGDIVVLNNGVVAGRRVVDPDAVGWCGDDAVGSDGTDIHIAARGAYHNAVQSAGSDAADQAVALHACCAGGAEYVNAVAESADRGEVLHRRVAPGRRHADAVEHATLRRAGSLAIDEDAAGCRRRRDTPAAVTHVRGSGSDARRASRGGSVNTVDRLARHVSVLHDGDSARACRVRLKTGRRARDSAVRLDITDVDVAARRGRQHAPSSIAGEGAVALDVVIAGSVDLPDSSTPAGDGGKIIRGQRAAACNKIDAVDPCCNYARSRAICRDIASRRT